jgi:RNA polymerase sigma-B factor
MAPDSLTVAQSSGRALRYDDADLLKRYHAHRDPRDRAALVERYLPLALHLSRRYFSADERDDLEQVASLGLLKAIDRFDPSRGIAFTSFAVPTIVGELKRYFRDLGWSVRVPRSLKELAARVDSVSETLLRELGRPPTVAEIAQRCETTTEMVLEARGLASAHRAASLDAPVDDEHASTRLDTVAVEDDGFGRAERTADLDRLLSRLPPREQRLLRLRFYEDLTQREIADRLGLSQMHVSRLIRLAITALSELASEPEAAAGRPLLMGSTRSLTDTRTGGALANLA